MKTSTPKSTARWRARTLMAQGPMRKRQQVDCRSCAPRPRRERGGGGGGGEREASLAAARRLKRADSADNVGT